MAMKKARHPKQQYYKSVSYRVQNSAEKFCHVILVQVCLQVCLPPYFQNPSYMYAPGNTARNFKWITILSLHMKE